MGKKGWVGVALITLLLIGAIIVGVVMSHVEQPKYTIVSSEGKIEVREYSPIVIAEVEVTGERKSAISQGFRQLADYIFGNNTVSQKIAMAAPVNQQESHKIAMTAPVQQQESQKIAMTAPVQQQESQKIAMTAPVQQQESQKIAMTAPVQQQESQKIAMTAPVQQQESQKIAMTAPVQQQESQRIVMTAPVQQQGQSKSWKVSFVMPSEYTMDSLPKPNNDQVTIKAVPSKQFVVIRFSGRNTAKNIARYEARLNQYIKDKQLMTVGLPKYAFYNPPWTLPFMRRNEIMIELKK